MTGARPKRLPRFLAVAILALGYATTLVVARAGRWRPRSRVLPRGRIAMVGTFHNPNWILSHAIPLARSGAESVLVVGDVSLPPRDNIRFVHPPAWLRRLAGRALSKVLWLLAVGRRERPDLYVGLHLFPGALSALIVARLLGRPACYQMTGGPVEIAGGGVANENWLMASLARPSPLVERLALAVVREFELVVALGRKATTFLEERGVKGVVAIIPGSIAPPAPPPDSGRTIDLVFVGRLTDIKQPLRFVDVVAETQKAHGALRAAIVGDGPLLADVKRRVADLGLDETVDVLGQRDDVDLIVRRSKVFVLTSRSEGLSIAMTEAMAAGAVPVVADVGELGDLVDPGRNGFLVEPRDTAAYARHIGALLADAQLRTRLSQATEQDARGHVGREAVAARWGRAVQRVGAMPASPLLQQGVGG